MLLLQSALPPGVRLVIGITLRSAFELKDLEQQGTSKGGLMSPGFG